MQNETTNNSRNDYFYFALLLFGHIILIWILPYFPTQDGPSHMYNLIILNDLLHGGKDWSDYYTINYQLVPNLGFHVIALPLLQIWSPIVTEKIFVTLYVILLGSGYLFFLHSFEKPMFPSAYFVLPVIFNFTLLMGNYSYSIAIPLYIVALALIWKLRNANTTVRLLILNIMGVFLFLFHLIPFCLYIISLLINLLACADKKGTVQFYIKQLCLILPCMLILMLYLWNSSEIYQFSQIFQKDQTAFNSMKSILVGKLFLICELILFSTDTFSRWQLVPASIFGFFVMCFSYESLKVLISKLNNHDKLSPINKFFFLHNIIFIGIYLLAPFRWGSGSFFNERLPWVIFLFLVPIFKIPKGILQKKIRPLIILLVILFLALNSVIFLKESKKVQYFLSGSQIDIPKGSFLMTYKNSVNGWARVDTIRHAASYYGIKNRCVDIGNYQARTDFFLIEFKKTLPDFPQLFQIENKPETINLSRFPSIQHVLGFDLTEFDKEKLKCFFSKIFEKNNLSIWKKSS